MNRVRDQNLPEGIPLQNVSHTAKIMLGYKSDDKNDPGLHLRTYSRWLSCVTARVPRQVADGDLRACRVDAGVQRFAVCACAQLGRL